MRPSTIPTLLADPALPERIRDALEEIGRATHPWQADEAKRRAAVLLAIAYRMPWSDAAELVELQPQQGFMMRPAEA